MHIVVNGLREKANPGSIAELIRCKGLPTDGLVVEYNQCIVAQAQWEHIALKENDTLELLSFVGGG